MKLLRWGEPGRERPGALDSEGRARDLSPAIADIDGAILGAAGLARLRSLDLRSFPVLDQKTRLGPPVGKIGKIIGVGLNYRDHAEEIGLAVSPEPTTFLKALSSLAGPSDPTIVPKNATKMDWEVELAIVIGERARCVELAEAARHVAGYCTFIDFSERAFQFEHCGNTSKGKSCDSFGPLGPWLVTSDEVANPSDLALWLEVNGGRMQEGNTGKMICSPLALVSYISQFMTLNPGDVIATGTPAGVGHSHKPPRYLVPGDRVRCGVVGLGEQNHELIREA